MQSIPLPQFNTIIHGWNAHRDILNAHQADLVTEIQRLRLEKIDLERRLAETEGTNKLLLEMAMQHQAEAKARSEASKKSAATKKANAAKKPAKTAAK